MWRPDVLVYVVRKVFEVALLEGCVGVHLENHTNSAVWGVSLTIATSESNSGNSVAAVGEAGVVSGNANDGEGSGLRHISRINADLSAWQVIAKRS